MTTTVPRHDERLPGRLQATYVPAPDVDPLAVVRRLGPLPVPVRDAQDAVESAVTSAAAAAWALLTDDAT